MSSHRLAPSPPRHFSAEFAELTLLLLSKAVERGKNHHVEVRLIVHDYGRHGPSTVPQLASPSFALGEAGSAEWRVGEGAEVEVGLMQDREKCYD